MMTTLLYRPDLRVGAEFANSIPPILLANSEASKFRLAFHCFEGTEAWKKLGGNLGFIAVK